jgi:hypothetical protein
MREGMTSPTPAPRNETCDIEDCDCGGQDVTHFCPSTPLETALYHEVQTQRKTIAELRAALDSFKQMFGPLMDEADWHEERCDCAGCQWFQKARALLRSTSAPEVRP